MTKRRSKGDGGLYQRHDHSSCPPVDASGERPAHKCQGRWVGNVEVLVEGKRKRKAVYGRTKKEAQVKLAKALQERRSGTLVVASMTTSGWLEYWLEHIAARDLKPQTLRGYRSKVDLYLIPHLGRHRLTALRPDHIREMHDWMRDKGLAEATVRQTHAILKKALRDAIYEGRLAVSPADRVKSPKTVTEQRAALSLPDAVRVLRTAGEDPRWWLALFYGMRQGECLGLRWADVDFDAKLIHIRQTLQTDTAYKIIFGPPKSRNSRRTIPMLGQIEVRLKLAYVAAGDPSPETLVFMRNGRPIWPNEDWEAWRDLLVRATVPPLAPVPHVALHAARNTAASLMEAAGIPDRMVMEILGHSQVQITHGYQSSDMERKRAALAGAERLLELGD